MPIGDIANYTVRVRQYTATNPTGYFYTNYECTVLSPVTVAEIDSFCDKIQQFHVELQRPDIFSDKVVFSTWLPDSEPYNADESHSYENTVQGSYSPALVGSIAPLETCLKLKRSVQTGISGNIALRGALYQGEYRGSGATMIAENVSAQRLRVLEAVDVSGLSNHFRPSEESIKLAMLGLNELGQQTFRLIDSFAFQKVGNVNVSKRYFDVPA